MQCEYLFNCPLPNGLHARPASALAAATSGWTSLIRLTNTRTGASADAASVLELVALGLMSDDPCLVTCQGTDAEQACASLSRFIEQQLALSDAPLPVVETARTGGVPHLLTDCTSRLTIGTPVSPGVGIGKVVHVTSFELPPEIANAQAGPPQVELAEAQVAFANVIAGLRQTPLHAEHSTATEIRQALQALAADQALFNAVEAGINAHGRTAAQAIIAAIDSFVLRLEETASAYLIERIPDLKDIGISLLAQLPGINLSSREVVLKAPSILLADTLATSQLLKLDRRLFKGLVLSAAGTTSHVAILARSLCIPCITDITQLNSYGPGTDVLIDGAHGLIAGPVDDILRRYCEFETRLAERQAAHLAKLKDEPSATADGQRIELAANVASAEEAELAFSTGAEGIGLFRTEMLFSTVQAEPTEVDQYAVLRQSVEAMHGRKVIIRTLDIGGDKPLSYLDLPAETNPFLGYRGVRIYQQHLPLFKRHLWAIIRASAHGEVWLMAPMISSVEEARWFREQVRAVQAELTAEGIAFNPEMPVGIMLEIPAAALIIDQLCEYVDFFSVGTNDLTQYLLAVDRGNLAVASLFQEVHPALIRLLQEIVERAHHHKKWVGLCGELARNPQYAALLIGLGFDELSMSVPAIPTLKQAVAGCDSQVSRSLVARASQCATAEQVKQTLASLESATRQYPLIDSQLIKLDADCQSKSEAIRELGALNHLHGRCHDLDELETAIWEREATYSTGLGYGIAIPHCKAETVSSGSLSVLKLTNPVAWQALDDQPVDIVIMLAMPTHEQGNRHLKVFAALARKLMHEEFRAGLRAQADPASMMSFLAHELELDNPKG